MLSGYKSISNTTSLVSMLIPSRTSILDITKMLSSEISKTQNIKAKHTRNEVKSSLSSISNTIKLYKFLPNNGLAIFCGLTTDGFINEFIEPKQPITKFFYRCDNNFRV